MKAIAASLLIAAAALAACGRPASKWADHKGDIPFVVGRTAGMSQAETTGKPPMYFFTATW